MKIVKHRISEKMKYNPNPRCDIKEASDDWAWICF